MTPKELWANIKKYKSFLITTHYNPDADAAASCLSLAMVLKALGKKAVVVNGDHLSPWLAFLPYAKHFRKKTTIKKPVFEAVIILDCGDMERIGSVRQWLDGQPLINIDHHVTNSLFGDGNLVCPQASSTCEILFEVFKAARVKLTKQLAMLLYAGIMTDTGSFRFTNTSARTHAIIACLLSFGLSAANLYQRLYPGIPSADIKKFVEVIGEAELLLNNRVYCALLSKKVMDSFSKRFDLKEKIFGLLRMVEGIEVIVILSQLGTSQTRINLRSQNRFNVARLAAKFNGGGHERASGAKVNIGLEEAKKKVIATIKKSL